MWRRIIQALGHCVVAPFGYDVCLETTKDERRVWTQKLVLARQVIVRETVFVVESGAFAREYREYASALRMSSELIQTHSAVNIWQEERVSRLVSKRTKS